MSEVGTIAVIGAGALGRSIAQLAALGGFPTILEDILPASLNRAGNEIRAALGQALAHGALAQPAVDAALARIEYASSVEQAARSASLVIEAVPDELESKIEIFTLLDKVAKPATILVSTAALLSVTELATVTYRAKKILGMRFTLPNDQTQPLEIIRGHETDDATLAAGVEVARRMGLKIVVIQESRSTAEAG
ncbi:MAG TPA: 3-hydroxyacyl-CoA dehydrogenase NAD-binding domain-containing protein [Candidatus Angelobacter sp.]|nr:3-hydroxyacyl-CoA dehydrogenase NAD-binding domain-containing protein [Candidatus Angelobacter sp.]